MSYQFEDDSALEELLNEQLNRRKQQTSASSKQNRNSSRPTTGPGVKASQQAAAPSGTPSAFRPSTASSLLHRQPTTIAAPLEAAADELASSLPSSSGGGAASRGKSLSSWLQGSHGGAGRPRRDEEKVAASSLQRLNAAAATAAAAEAEEDLATNTNREMPRAKFVSPANTSAINGAAAAADLDNLLSPSRLQEMSKQRLIQVILEEVAPRLANQKGLVAGESARQVDRLERELQLERNRLAVAEMRHEEQLKLEGQKWQQVNQQLESRLAGQELQMGQLVESQREHLRQLGEQYQGQLAKLSEIFDQRLSDEKRRFEEILEGRETMHKLELEAKLNVNCDLMRLNTLQAEWRKTLEMTINQLSDHYKSVEALLDKQAVQVNASGSDLATKARTLCDQYDKYDECNRRLVQAATEWRQLMPSVAQAQARGESVLVGVEAKLACLDGKLNELAKSQKQLEQSKLELTELGGKMSEDKFKLALDSSRVSMKEERLDELLGRNSTLELQLSSERKSVGELQTQMQLKRVALDERFADLKEQNYALHLLRKRLTTQKEELLKAQLEFAEERKSSKSDRAQVDDEMKRLGTLRVRVQRELDQLRRLQRSLVCSLCMSRLFGGAGPTETTNAKQEEALLNDNQQSADEQIMNRLGFVQSSGVGGSAIGRLGVAAARVDRLGRDVEQSMPADERSRDIDISDTNELDGQRKRTERERSRLAAESRYVEQLFGGFA